MSYEFEHVVECRVGKDFAWRFWSGVENWVAVDPSIEAVTLDGPFAAGTRGVTKPRGVDPVEWKLTEVREGESAIIEVAVPGAVMRLLWVFEEAAGGGARISQRVTLEGESAVIYSGAMRQMEEGMPEGMNRLTQAMVAATDGTT